MIVIKKYGNRFAYVPDIVTRKSKIEFVAVYFAAISSSSCFLPCWKKHGVATHFICFVLFQGNFVSSVDRLPYMCGVNSCRNFRLVPFLLLPNIVM